MTNVKTSEEDRHMQASPWLKNWGFGGSVPDEPSPSAHEDSLPSKDPTLAEIDTLLANEMNKLKIEERDRVYEELHGVDQGVEETPDLVAKKLSEFDHELQMISHKPAYDQAESISREYVAELRLKFLRAECFDPHKAVKRFVYFFEGMLETFGIKALARPLRLTDMEKDDMACLKTGHIQILSVRDPSGRAIFCDMQNHDARSYKRIINMKRTAVYLLSAAAEDEETQKRGFVFLLFHMLPIKLGNFDRELFYKVPTILDWLPIRIKAAHFCYNDPLLQSLIAVSRLTCGPEVRSKYRTHRGTLTECKYKLMTFGIPVESMPLAYDGAVKVDGHRKWIAKRKAKDLKLKEAGWNISFEGIDIPRPNDVLLGRGKPFRDHLGNMRLRTVVDQYRQEYEQAKFGQKIVIAEQVAQYVNNQKGRFLKHKNDGWWAEVNKDEALDKVGHTFRTARSAATESQYTMLENRKRIKVLQEKQDKIDCAQCFCGQQHRPAGPSFYAG